MSIDRNNYEMFILDYLEGKLSPEQVDELVLFLDSNPELREECELVESYTLDADTAVSYPFKEDLKKNITYATGPINETNYEAYMILFLEGEASRQEEHMFHRFLARNQHLQKEFNLLKKTFLQPDLSITFTNKSRLKKRKAALLLRHPWVWAVSSAAAILIILLLVFHPFRTHRAPGIEFVESAEESVSKPDLNGQVIAIPGDSEQTGILQPSQKEVPAIQSGTRIQVKKSQETTPEDINDLAIHQEQERTSIPSKLEIITITPDGKPFTVELAQQKGILENDENGFLSRQYPVVTTTNDDQAFSRMKENSYSSSAFTFVYKAIKNVFQKKNDTPKESSDFSFWGLVDLGMYGISQITGNDVSLNRMKDEEGKVVAYALKSDDFEISRDKRDKKEKSRTGFE